MLSPVPKVQLILKYPFGAIVWNKIPAKNLTERSDCVNFRVKKYGYMPLQKAEFRADPVLFKGKFPEKLKNFVNIGSP